MSGAGPSGAGQASGFGLRLEGVTRRFRLGRPLPGRRDSEGFGGASGRGLAGDGQVGDGGTGGDGWAGVDGISLGAGPGETLVLFGPSGSGKTTLLRLIAGLERCERGQVWLGDCEVTCWSPQRRAVALVSQSPALYPHLTVEANLAFGLRHSKLLGVFDVIRRVFPRGSFGLAEQGGPETSVWENRVRQVVRDFQLGHLLDRWPHQLSGGERQRVAIGRAAARDPAAFLFDEPLAGIDAQLRLRLRGCLADHLRHSGATAVYVTHDFAEAMVLGHRLAVLDRGRLLQLGAPREVYRNPASIRVAQIFGPRGINLWSLAHKLTTQEAGGGDWRSCWWGRWVVEQGPTFPLGRDAERAAGGFPDVCLGIRPESVRVCAVDTGDLTAEVVRGEDLGGEVWWAVRGVRPNKAGFGSVAEGQGGERRMGTAAAAGCVSGSADGLELGGDWWVQGERGNGGMRPDASGRVPVIGQRVGLKLERDRLHLFGATSGRNIGKEFNEAQ